MALVRTNYPIFNNLFDNLLSTELNDWREPEYAFGKTVPKVNIKSDDQGYTVEMAVPGLQKSDFNIELDNDLLTISAERKAEQNEEKGNYTRKEFSYHSFKRSFTLPETADGEKISAAYENGVLLVAIPKKEEAKPKTPLSISVA